jgi:predicted transcriptional regulator
VGQQQSQRHGEPSALAALRALVPRRPLSYSEALRVAELQADLLLRLAKIKEPPVPTDIVSRLPRMQVVCVGDSPVAGSVHWDGHDWIVVVNSRQHEPRRRYSLAHEFKHVIDHTTRAFLYTGMPRMTAAEQAERAADYFAGCLLMPHRQLKAAATDGCRTAAEYASRFVVPTAAAEKRLAQLGLAPPRSRQVRLVLEDTRPEQELDTVMGPKA